MSSQEAEATRRAVRTYERELASLVRDYATLEAYVRRVVAKRAYVEPSKPVLALLEKGMT